MDRLRDQRLSEHDYVASSPPRTSTASDQDHPRHRVDEARTFWPARARRGRPREGVDGTFISHWCGDEASAGVVLRTELLSVKKLRQA
jgi:hypothetical protein